MCAKQTGRVHVLPTAMSASQKSWPTRAPLSRRGELLPTKVGALTSPCTLAPAPIYRTPLVGPRRTLRGARSRRRWHPSSTSDAVDKRCSPSTKMGPSPASPATSRRASTARPEPGATRVRGNHARGPVGTIKSRPDPR
eukprot:scaffold1074_cov409-Prasinococcus_capsulatus_cf.AAC.16